MAGRGRAATLPAWMTAPAPPPRRRGRTPGPPGVAPAPSPPPRRWTEHRAPDGRPYWNDGTRSTYAKPQGTQTPMERADASTRWRENRAPDGRTYYHQDTRETRWSLPDDLRLAREAAARAQTAIAAAAAARSSSPAPTTTRSRRRRIHGPIHGQPESSGPRDSRDPQRPAARLRRQGGSQGGVQGAPRGLRDSRAVEAMGRDREADRRRRALRRAENDRRQEAVLQRVPDPAGEARARGEEGGGQGGEGELHRHARRALARVWRRRPVARAAQASVTGPRRRHRRC